MKIAVLTPTLPERTEMLATCIASVKSQTRPANIHCIGLDTYRIGPAAIRNKLVRELPEEIDWLAFLDDDDQFLPRHLEKLSAVAEDADVVFSSSNLSNPALYPTHDYRRLVDGNYISITCLVRRSMFEFVGGFDKGLYEDWGLWKKITSVVGRFVFVPEVTWVYGQHSTDQRNKRIIGGDNGVRQRWAHN
jgi:glycosyltransferase involved in cell wall biosynthesis